MTTFAEIDTVIENGLTERLQAPSFDAVERGKASLAAKKFIAGFSIHDEAAERSALDAMIADRRVAIEQFLIDRRELREKLLRSGVNPLAIVPTKTWNAICRRSGLYILQPSGDRVRLSLPSIRDYLDQCRWKKESIINEFARSDWPKFIDACFPEGKEIVTHGSFVWNGKSYSTMTLSVNLLLPTPPADVCDILCKVQNPNLKVAAVADAIQFKQTPWEIREAIRITDEAKRAYEHWLRTDPIVYLEHGSASGILAQFGDFPIEKKVVEEVVASNDLIPDKRVELSPAFYATNGMLQASVNQMAISGSVFGGGVPLAYSGGR